MFEQSCAWRPITCSFTRLISGFHQRADQTFGFPRLASCVPTVGRPRSRKQMENDGMERSVVEWNRGVWDYHVTTILDRPSIHLVPVFDRVLPIPE